MRVAIAGGQSRCVVIAGDAGVGKSRLAAECLHAAQDAGHVTAHVLATRAASGLPLGAFAPALPAIDDSGRERLVDLLQAAELQLRERAGDRQLVLLVDDAHLLDEVSAALVLHLTRTGAAFVVATIRSGERWSDAIDALWKEGLGERLDLEPLEQSDVGSLLETVLGGRVDGATLRVLAHRSDGNILYLRELVQGALDQGTLTIAGGLWSLSGPLAPSQRLAELVGARLAGLEAEHRAALEIVAFGEPIGLAELASMADMATLEWLEDRELLSLSQSQRRTEARLGHPLHGEVLRSASSTIRRRAIARTLAEAIGATGARRGDDVLRIAVWRLDAGETADLEVLLDAAAIAASRFDHPLAERLALAAHAGGGGFRAELVAAQAAISLGRPVEGENRLAALAAKEADDEHQGRLALTRIDNLCYWLGRHDDALRVASAAERRIADPEWRDQISSKRLAVLYLGGRFAEFNEACAPVLESGSARQLSVVAMTAPFALGNCGRFEEALALIERIESEGQNPSSTPLWPSFVPHQARCLTLLWGGWLSEALTYTREQYDAAVAAGSGLAQGWFAVTMSRCQLARGDAKQAVRWGTEGIALLANGNSPTWVRGAGLMLAEALALAGSVSDAKAAYGDAVTAAPWAKQYELYRLAAAAWISVANGDLRAARSALLDAIALAGHAGAWTLGVTSAHDLARIGHADEALAPLERFAAQVEGPLAPMRVAHVTALVEGDVPRLRRVSIEFEESGTLLHAAEASADAALLSVKRGDRRAAMAAQRRAQDLSARCGNPRTPALMSLQARAELTRAERQIALIASGGATNREIAEQLVLSVRTVENTLQRVYAKLGIKGRGELSAAL